MSNAETYNTVIVEIFRRHYQPGIIYFEFNHSEIEEVVRQLEIESIKAYDDVIYSFRFRRPLPKEISDTAPQGGEWLIELSGQGVYRFRLSQINQIIPRINMRQIKIPDSTPEIVIKYLLSDEQALLAKIRYNRLIDIFLGITAYSLQNHLIATVTGIGEIEIDEIYVGLNRKGAQFVIPVQAQGSNNQISVIQTKQDIGYCTEKFPELICLPISVQLLRNDLIAMFELTLEDAEVKVVEEKQYKLVPSNQIFEEDLQSYKLYNMRTDS